MISFSKISPPPLSWRIPEFTGSFSLGDGAHFPHTGGYTGVFYKTSGSCQEDPSGGNVGPGTVHFSLGADDNYWMYVSGNLLYPNHYSCSWWMKVK